MNHVMEPAVLSEKLKGQYQTLKQGYKFHFLKKIATSIRIVHKLQPRERVPIGIITKDISHQKHQVNLSIGMAENAVLCVIQSLQNLLLSEARFIHDIRDSLRRIEEKLRRLQAICKTADARQHEDETIHDWVVETRKVAFAAEDILDIFAVQMSLRTEGSSVRRYVCLLKEFTSLHLLRTDISFIDDKISYLETDSRVCNLRPIGRGYIPNSLWEMYQYTRRSYSHDGEDFVGLDEDIEELVAQVVNEDGGGTICYQVVSIIGMGGIGKTALARKVYYHEHVRRHFDAFSWVCISRPWRLEDVLQSILNNLVPEMREQIGTMRNIGKLIKELSEVQIARKCFVVLDDVWDLDVWNSLRPAFPNLGSKMLFTTRNKGIARRIEAVSTCYLYEQRYLNQNESWELLQKNFFVGNHIEDVRSSTDSYHTCLTSLEEDHELLGDLKEPHFEDSFPDVTTQADLENLGMEMVGRCGGLPLAIIVLRGILMTQHSTLSDWRTKNQNLINLCFSTGGVHEVLALSYHDLPYQIKPCFLYFANFPEDYEIPTRKLYQLWAAEGFILSDNRTPGDEEESTMDVAERCLLELVERCMVQVQVEESTGRLKSCKLRGLTRELCLLKVKEESCCNESTTTSSSVHRLDCSDFEIPSWPPLNLENVRSVLFSTKINKDRKHLLLVLKFFKMLRVLDLERFDFDMKLLRAVSNLVHLRYLSLRGCLFNKLPSSIGNIRFLQTLDLRVPSNSCLIIPDVIWKLTRLRHLYLPPFLKAPNKLKLGSLTNLEILKNFDTRISDLGDLMELTKLQKLTATFCLEIDGLEVVKSNYLEMGSSFRFHFDFVSEEELTLLQQLVGGLRLHKLDLNGHIVRLPRHSCFSRRLTKLTLRGSKLNEDPMVTLERLPNLYSLILRENAFVGREIHCSAQGFRKLRILEFQRLDNLVQCTIEEGSMPNLQHLTVDECINLMMVPKDIEHLSTIEEMLIVNMSQDFIQRMQNGDGEILYEVKIIIDKKQESVSSPNELQGSGFFRSFSPETVPREWMNP